MKERFTKELNDLIAEFQEEGVNYEQHIGNGVSLESECGKILKNDIPKKLIEVFPTDTYKIKGSIGAGRISNCPWVAIMHKKETTSTQSGVYLVFLFSRNLKSVYLSLAQGVTGLKLSEIVDNRNNLRRQLRLENKILKHYNEQSIDGEKYKAGAIYSNEWRVDDNNYCEKLLTEFKNAYDIYMAMKVGDNVIKAIPASANDSEKEKTYFSMNRVIESIKQSGLLYDDKLIQRYACSLMTKPFVILSGLAGSGKTQLALTFARTMVENVKQQLCVVPVGADWTNREPLLGYPNALKPGEYIQPESGALQIMMRALKNPQKPYFLVLDEMNLSYVERYFADFLSALESRQEIPLWDKPETCDSVVPARIAMPKNLFIVGTINVDETTYMFSPKVLDRANVIEFKITEREMEQFLMQDRWVDVNAVDGLCADMGRDFLERATNHNTSTSELAKETLISFFKVLKRVNAEFGYRSATEIYRFIANAKTMAVGITDEDILDAAIVQKLLPKLHGSRKKLEPVLIQLWKLCFSGADKELNIAQENVKKALYHESADKICRMYDAAAANGFTSFAEA